MRVAFDVGTVRDEPTGVGLFASSMATALSSQAEAHDLVLIGRRDGVRALPDRIASMPFRAGPYARWLQTVAPRDIRRVRADIAHFSQGMVPIFRTTRTVLSVHDMSLVRLWRSHPLPRLIQIPLALLSPRLADLTMVPSRATADELIRLTGTPAGKIEVVPYAPRDHPASSKEIIRAALERHRLNSRGYILALGTIEPRKNHARLVRAFEIAVRKKLIPADMELVIAGQAGWHAAPVLDRIHHSPLSRRIKYLGYVPPGDLHPLLSNAAAVAYVSLYEGFGLPVIEAMACGTPTVTSNISSMPEVAGDAGFLVNPIDPADIARGLADALAADRATVELRSTAQARRYSWTSVARTAVALYRQLLA